jgi:23S rRNA (guanine2445-N2)-methyltransferase / 23S rRNA (guanine2069-N7)-methyltransferase
MNESSGAEMMEEDDDVPCEQLAPLDDRADEAKSKQQADLFGRRLDKLAKHLRRYPTKQGITCYRLYERDIPEIPLVVDRYEDHLHLTEYSTPYQRTAAQHARWLDLMAKTATEVLGVETKKVFFKRRNRQIGTTQHEHIADEKYELVVGEGGLRFIVNLSDYIDTGLFLDHRLTRSMVREVANGKRFLNLFAYTGSFTVYAAAGGATSTTTVDWSNTYLDWAKRNMALNHFVSPVHAYVRESAVDFVYNHPRKPSYELAVVDPPTFSNSKRTESLWDVQRDAVPLLEQLILLMSPGGVIYFSNNFRQFKMDASTLPVTQIHEISNQTVPANYRNRKIHRCWRIVV